MTPVSPLFVLDSAKCNRCGLCVKDCPVRVIELDANGYPEVRAEREAGCVRCQHCLAICPEGAVCIDGKRPEDSLAVEAAAVPTFEQMDRLVRARRSVRQYRSSDVEPRLIAQLLASLEHAPTGVNARQLTFTLIEQRDVLSALRTKIFDAIALAAEQGQLTEKTLFLGKMAERWREKSQDLIFRGAPHLLVVSAPLTTPCPQQDVALTLAYFELLAQSAGLGTVWCGYLRVVLEALPALKPLLGLNETDVYYAMLFGHSAVKYARTVQREGTATIRRVSSL
jgi:nitroreductase/NAD-dependent dihydropyrimidine dehydrogenase PreA subunit